MQPLILILSRESGETQPALCLESDPSLLLGDLNSTASPSFAALNEALLKPNGHFNFFYFVEYRASRLCCKITREGTLIFRCERILHGADPADRLSFFLHHDSITREVICISYYPRGSLIMGNLFQDLKNSALHSSTGDAPNSRRTQCIR